MLVHVFIVFDANQGIIWIPREFDVNVRADPAAAGG